MDTTTVLYITYGSFLFTVLLAIRNFYRIHKLSKNARSLLDKIRAIANLDIIEGRDFRWRYDSFEQNYTNKYNSMVYSFKSIDSFFENPECLKEFKSEETERC